MKQQHLELRRKLRGLSEEGYKNFSGRLNPGLRVLGVRLPRLRALAANLLNAAGTAGNFLAPYDPGDELYLEELMVRALLVAHSPAGDRISLVRGFLPLINGWAVCDLLCGELKEARNSPGAYWELVSECLVSKHPGTARFALVMSLRYFTDTEYLDTLFKAMDRIDSSDYYVHLGLSWLLAELYIRHGEIILSYLKKGTLPPRTVRQALRKMRESLRVSSSDKLRLAGLSLRL